MPNINDILGKLGAGASADSSVPPLPGSYPGFSQDVGNPESIEQESAFDAREVTEIAKKDLNFFSGLILPSVITMLFPAFYLAIWHLLLEKVNMVRDFSKIAIGIPRGFAKTTFIKIFVVYCVLFTNKKLILIVASTATLAENILADIADMLDEENIKTLFGNWRLGLEKDSQALKKFGYRNRSITIAALGAGSSLRGLNLKHNRPDLIIMEDIQTREGAASDIEARALYQWMLSTLMKTRSHLGCLYIFIGNMYPYEGSILRKLKSNTQWVKLITGGILANFTSLWEELQPIKQLLQELKHDVEAGHPEIFFAEVQNDETSGGRSGIDVRKMPNPNPALFKELPQGSFIIIDPGGKRKKSDNTVIGRFSVYDGKPYLVELVNEVLSPGDTIKRSLVMALVHKTPLICVENVAYQDTLLYWFNFFAEKLQLEGIAFQPVDPQGVSKNARIKRVFQELIAGETLIAQTVRAEVFGQIAAFDPLSQKNKDDILDILGYVRKIIEVYWHLLTMPIMMAGIDDSYHASVRSEAATSAI